MQNQINGQIPNTISSPAVNPQANSLTNYVDIIQQLEQAIKTDVQRLQILMQQGVLNQNQGQFLMSQLAKKANEINMCKNAVSQMNAVSNQNTQAQPVQSQNPTNPLDLFNQENPGFFNSGSRAAVLDYIKNLNMDKDEIIQIAKLVENLENDAIENYLKKSAHEKSLNDENYTAKSKLTAYAQNAPSNSKYSRIFTREDIGNMSGEEFAKNEKLIMEQVKQGLIK